MKFTIRMVLVAVAVTVALSIAMSAQAADLDLDLVDDAFDNCSQVPNGPNDLSNQVDTDNDGFGNACDCDFTQDGINLGDDLQLLRAAFYSTQELYDVDGDGFVLGIDVYICGVENFGFPPGPGPM
jgi:hypothetical protein